MVRKTFYKTQTSCFIWLHLDFPLCSYSFKVQGMKNQVTYGPCLIRKHLQKKVQNNIFVLLDFQKYCWPNCAHFWCFFEISNMVTFPLMVGKSNQLQAVLTKRNTQKTLNGTHMEFFALFL